MCGIVGVISNNEAAPQLVEALKRLEYRGYDSAGIATVHEQRLDRRREVGKLVNLADKLVHEPLAGKVGIGHTRWATHGAPSVGNAHPHLAGRVAVVHNGIIENYRELRAELAELGVPFQTETDTETIALLCEHYLATGLGPQEAATATIARLEGAFALCFIFDGEEDLLIAARRGSPLAVGHGDGEMFIGSDAIALAPMTNRITYLEEGDRAEITRAGATIYDHSGTLANREIREVNLAHTQVEKGGHKHFMAKEIHEQPAVLADCLKTYISNEAITLPEPFDFTGIDRIIMVACGTAHIACTVAKYWFEQLARLPVEVDIASEFRYREPPIQARTATIFVSQSGETADTLAALRYCKDKAQSVLSVVNVPESSIARESDVSFPIHAGVEVGVASTKAFTNQLAVLMSLAITAARQRGAIDAAREAELVGQFAHVPGLINQALGLSGHISDLSRKLATASDILFLGRGSMYPMAHEGALKLKEISYIHAEAYASGELKHGPIALVEETLPVVVLAPCDALFDKTVSNMQEVMARKGMVLLVSDAAGIIQAGDGVWATIQMPDVEPIFAPLVYVVPAQLLAYHTAVHKGTDVDQPRNLAKSVTVE